MTPAAKNLVYEVFVREFQDGPIPTLWADLLVTVDGLKAFHARRMGLRLVPDWPLTSMTKLLDEHVELRAQGALLVLGDADNLVEQVAAQPARRAVALDAFLRIQANLLVRGGAGRGDLSPDKSA